MEMSTQYLRMSDLEKLTGWKRETLRTHLRQGEYRLEVVDAVFQFTRIPSSNIERLIFEQFLDCETNHKKTKEMLDFYLLLGKKTDSEEYHIRNLQNVDFCGLVERYRELWAGVKERMSKYGFHKTNLSLLSDHPPLQRLFPKQ